MSERAQVMEHRQPLVAWTRSLMTVILAASVVVGCGSPVADGDRQEAQSPEQDTVPVQERSFVDPTEVRGVWGSWEAFAAVSQVSYYSSTADMVADVPMIVDGIVADAGYSRTAGPTEDPVRYSVVTLQVLDYLKGDGPDLLPVEVFIGGGAIEENSAELIGSRLLGFVMPQDVDLRRAGATDTEIADAVGRYRFNNSQGIFVNSQAGLVQPYAEPGTADVLSISEQPYDRARGEVEDLLSRIED